MPLPALATQRGLPYQAARETQAAKKPADNWLRVLVAFDGGVSNVGCTI